MTGQNSRPGHSFSSSSEAGARTPTPATRAATGGGAGGPLPPAYSSPFPVHDVPLGIRYDQPRTPPVPLPGSKSRLPVGPEPEPEAEPAWRHYHEHFSRTGPETYEMNPLPYTHTHQHHHHGPQEPYPLNHTRLTPDTPGQASSSHLWALKLILGVCIAILAAAVIALSIELAACNDNNSNQLPPAAAAPVVSTSISTLTSVLTSIATTTARQTTATVSITTTLVTITTITAPTTSTLVSTQTATPTTVISSVSVTVTSTVTTSRLPVSTSVVVITITAGAASGSGSGDDSPDITMTRTVMPKHSLATADFTMTLTTTSSVGDGNRGGGTNGGSVTMTAGEAKGTFASLMEEYNCTPDCNTGNTWPGIQILDRHGNSSYCANIMINIYDNCTTHHDCTADNTVTDRGDLREQMLEKVASCFFMCGKDLITVRCECGLAVGELGCAACES